MITKEDKNTSHPPYPVRRFWNAAYIAGCRITFTQNRFHFHRAELPLLRVQRAGNRFGIFSESEAVQPEPWILDGIEEHNGTLISWLSQPWPKPLERFAWHVLIEAHELTPLCWFARSLGHQVSGWAATGGWIPFYVGKQAAAPTPSREQAGLPAILAGWKEIAF